MHANFIINVGNASAQHVAELLAHARRTVHETFGIELTPEVHFTGVFTAAPAEFSELVGR